MTNEQFWDEVEFAQANPQLYGQIDDFRRWMNLPGHSPLSLESTLIEYWGMKKDQVEAWTRWYFAAHFGRNDVIANLLKEHALDITIRRDPWPARFEMYRTATAVDDGY